MATAGLTNPCEKQTTKAAVLLRDVKSPRGMIGYFASFFWLKTNNTAMNNLKTMRQITLGGFQGKVTPPKFRPSRGITARPTIVILPYQSITLNASDI